MAGVGRGHHLSVCVICAVGYQRSCDIHITKDKLHGGNSDEWNRRWRKSILGETRKT